MDAEALKSLSLNNPVHLELVSNGGGEFPDGYRLTEAGVQEILDAEREATTPATWVTHMDLVPGDVIVEVDHHAGLVLVSHPEEA